MAMPHCGMAANSTSGGEVTEREVIPRLAAHGIDAHLLRPVCPGLRWWNSPALFTRPLGACLRHHAPALIRLHSVRYTGLAALAARRLSGVAISAHFHHLDGDRLAWLDRFVLRRVDQVTTDSEFSQRQAARIGVKADVVRLGVDHRRFHPSPMPEGQIVLLVGGTKRRKNALFVRRLWPEILRRVPEATLLEVGQGSRVDDACMPSSYRVARVVAFPSLLEGFGLPVLEAMACGRPVVCSTAGALPELRASLTVRLDPERWVTAIVELLTDDVLWRQFAEANHAEAVRYDWDHTAADMAHLWRARARTGA